MKSISIDQITSKNPSILKLRQKNEFLITEVLPAELAKPTSLVFASNKTLFKMAIENRSQAII